jgi:hypothetical protein
VLAAPGVGVTRSGSTVKPLHITGRVLRANELPGFVPKERATVVASASAWNKVAPEGGINVEARLRAAGFVSAVREDLEWEHGNDRAALSVVVRLRSVVDARAEITRELRDAPDQVNRGVAKSHTPFVVPAIPGAHGFTHIGTTSSGHNIVFADGDFIYWVGVGWGNQAKDQPTRDQLIAAATSQLMPMIGMTTNEHWVEVEHHAVNQGKGVALRHGYRLAARRDVPLHRLWRRPGTVQGSGREALAAQGTRRQLRTGISAGAAVAAALPNKDSPL